MTARVRVVDLDDVARIKAEGHGLRHIAEKLKIGYGTVRMRLASSERISLRPKAAVTAEMQRITLPFGAGDKH